MAIPAYSLEIEIEIEIWKGSLVHIGLGYEAGLIYRQVSHDAVIPWERSDEGGWLLLVVSCALPGTRVRDLGILGFLVSL